MSDGLAADFAAAYPDLLRLARARLAHENTPISAATLVHELFVDLQARTGLRFEERGAFLAYAARAMRSLVVDMARQRLADKRHAELLPLTIADGIVADLQPGPEQLVAWNQALERLGRAEARLLQVAEMRAVLGLSVAEVAQALGIAEPTVKRDWQRARAFLLDALTPTR